MTTDEDAGRAFAAERAELAQLRDRVVNVVGHALATPVATLRGLVGALDADLDEAERAKVVAALDRTSARIEELVDDLLVASGIETRIPHEDPADVDLAALVRTCWDEVGQGGALSLTGAGVALAPRRTTTWMVRQLLDNAARYGAGGCTVDLGGGDGRVVVTITNEGAPLPPDEVAHAFELFYRGHDAVMRVAARLGIGLAVVRQLQERAGATVELQAREGGGAIVTATFPRRGAGA